MARLYLRDVLLDGRITPFSLDSTPSVLRRAVGPPERWGGSGEDAPGTIWRYGDIELLFDFSDPPICFCLELHAFHDVPVGGAGVEVDPWIIREGMSLARFRMEIGQAGGRCEDLPVRAKALVELATHRAPLVKVSFGTDIRTDGQPGLTGIWVTL